MSIQKPSFAPELYIDNGVTDLSFYEKAFGATINLLFRNEDHSIHVAEFEIDGAIFHVHEISSALFSSPTKLGKCSCCIGLFVDEVQQVFDRAINAGAKAISAVTDYEYGYRQGSFQDPFGHYWQIQKKIPV